jgi:thymidylate synthase ThyX
MITAEIVADSIHNNNRITSFVLTYPRFIHAEVLTHKILSKSSSSSRAIPIKKMIDDIKNTPAMPIYWGKNMSGMKAIEELDSVLIEKSKQSWIQAMEDAIKHSEELLAIGNHKQVANRLTEPFQHMRVLITGTDYDNFFALRYHEDAQPEFKELADAMLYQYVTNTPNTLKYTDWHLPFCDRFVDGLTIEQKLKVATARAARVSYMTFNNEIDYEKDYILHDELLQSGHFSCFEHSAKAGDYGRVGNFNGWLQYRKTFPTSTEVRSFDYDKYKISKGLI